MVSAATTTIGQVAATLSDIGEAKLTALCAGLKLTGRQQDAARRVFQELTSPWGDWPVGLTPTFPTDITDDGTPFEFSVAFGCGLPKLRMLVEAQRSPFTPDSAWDASLEINERLTRFRGVDLSRFAAVRDLFAPQEGVPSRFVLWHAADIDDEGVPSFKMYLNPQVLGPEAAPGLLYQALERLGCGAGAAFLTQKLAEGSTRNELLYLSLDLVKGARARVKIYVAHRNATVEQIEAQLRDCAGYVAGDATRWLGALTQSGGPFVARPILTCLGFSGAAAPTVTLHIPTRCYVDHDAQTVERLREFLSAADHAKLQMGLSGVAARPLHVGRSLVTYVSLRRAGDNLRITTDLAPEAYAISAPRPTVRPSAAVSSTEPLYSMIRDLAPRETRTLRDVQEAIDRQRAHLASHPFLQRLDSEGGIEEIRALAPRLTFFVMAFQDVLRLARARTSDPELARVARQHESEDAGHDRWFLHDLAQLSSVPTIDWLFSKDHETTRDVAYALVSDVLAAADDHTRLAVVLSLESIGAEFFGRIIAYLERVRRGAGLRYFARPHQKIETEHAVFGEEAATQLSARPIDELGFQEATRAVERTFVAMSRLATDLHAAMVRSVASATG